MIANYLQEYCTGVNIKYYDSKIIDLVHGYSDDIISVIVNVYDNYGNEIENGLETIVENDYLFTVVDKIDVVKYVSIFWHWNLDLLTIELVV
jgi:hypothetical protein